MTNESKARWALSVLLAINLLNYLDRQVLYSLLPLIKPELQANDAQLGALASAFMLVYMCAAPVVGYLADRSSRVGWIAAGVGFWSVATVFSGLAGTFRQLFAARSAVGIGEAFYGSVSPSFIAEYFPKNRRARVLAIFSMAIPVGSALGYVLGGAVGFHWGWRKAFFMAGIPGFLLALLALGLSDPHKIANTQRPEPAKMREYAAMARNRSWLLSTLSMAAMTFGLGAFAVWMPSYFTRIWGLNVSEAGRLFGILTVLGGLIGSLAGGWLADYVLKFNSRAYFLVSGLGLLASFPLACLALYLPSLPAVVAALLACEICVFLNMGPLNAVIVAVTEPKIRSMAFAANIFVIHALGDAASPTLVGLISDQAGLRAGLVFASVWLGIAGVLSLMGMRFMDADARLVEAHG